MSTKIATFLLQQGASFLWEYTNKGKFTEAQDKVAEIRKAQESMLRDVTSMHFEQLIWNSIQKIHYWTKSLESALEEEKKARGTETAPAKPYLSSEMKDLVDAIKSMGDGVGFHVDNIIAVVTGESAVASKDGLIGAWNNTAYNKLENLDKMDYTIKDYLYEVEANIRVIAKILQDANELRALIASDETQLQKWSNASGNSITSMQNKAWGLFPLALRKLKPSYRGQFTPESHWWRFENKGKGRYICVRPSYAYRGSPVEEASVGPCPPSEWRFASPFAELDQDGVVVESDQKKDRLVAIRSRIGDCRLGTQPGKMVIGIEKDGAPGFDPILVKVVPSLNTSEPEIRFVIKREKTSGPVRENGQWKYLGNALTDTYVLHDDGVGQFEYLAPADEPSRCVIC